VHAFNYELYGLKPLDLSSREGKAYIDPPPHGVPQVAVLDPPILGRFQAVQGDFSRDNAWYNRVISCAMGHFLGAFKITRLDLGSF